MNTTQNVDFEAYYHKSRKRAPIIALVLATATIISLIFLAFAFIQKTEADKLKSSLEQMKTQAEMQMQQALEQAKAAQQEAEQQRMLMVRTEELLKQCQSGKK